MKKETIVIIVMGIIIAVIVTVTIYYLVEKKKGTASTANSKTLQDYVNEASPGEQAEAKTAVDSFKNNFNEDFSEYKASQMLKYSDNQLAWASTYYTEQTGRKLYDDIDDLPTFGWSSISLVDGKIMDRLSKLSVQN